MGGLTIENNFFILIIEKRNKIIVFDLFLSRDFAYFIQYLLLFIHGQFRFNAKKDAITILV